MIPYQERTYRNRVNAPGLTCFRVVVKETDLWVCAEQDLGVETRDLVYDARHQLEHYIQSHPGFSSALSPLREDPFAPPLVKEMIRVSAQANVGPMASVAGVIAQYVGEGLLAVSDQIIVENGGDVFLKAHRPLTVSAFAGTSALSERLGIRIPLRQMPGSVCASSGTVGHSLSRGITDVVCVLSPSAGLADACATALGNRIRKPGDIEEAGRWAQGIQGIWGGMAVAGDHMAGWGDIELVPV
ncbi:MAG: UPF0280 family protein [Desulfatiglandaceae bacterium]